MHLQTSRNWYAPLLLFCRIVQKCKYLEAAGVTHVDLSEQEIEEVLAAAFQPPQMPHIDIFATAARIAEGK